MTSPSDYMCLYGFALLTASLPIPISANQTTTSGPSSLDDADVAAIVLGVILFVLIIGTILLCCLYYKGISHAAKHITIVGYLGRDDKASVKPAFPDFPDIYTTPDSLRRASAAAIDKSRETSETPRKKKDSEPIIYLYDDVYHPPKSRPLPGNGVNADPYPEVVKPVTAPRRNKGSIRQLFCNRPTVRKDKRHTKIIRDYKQSGHPVQPERSENNYDSDDVEVIPDSGRFSIRTYYGTRSPYLDKEDLSKTF